MKSHDPRRAESHHETLKVHDFWITHAHVRAGHRDRLSHHGWKGKRGGVERGKEIAWVYRMRKGTTDRVPRCISAWGRRRKLRFVRRYQCDKLRMRGAEERGNLRSAGDNAVLPKSSRETAKAMKAGPHTHIPSSRSSRPRVSRTALDTLFSQTP